MRQPGWARAGAAALVGLVLSACTGPGRAPALSADARHPEASQDVQEADEPTSSVEYRNDRYGFRLALPSTWQGYLTVEERWEGHIQGPRGNQVVETGPLVLLRHPGWTPERPRQDIPIMVFTPAQWHALQEGKFHTGVAPVRPTELGRNGRYVFALPSRYNYAHLPGYEEVERILASRPLQAFELAWPDPSPPRIVDVSLHPRPAENGGWSVLPPGAGEVEIRIVAEGATRVRVFLVPTGTKVRAVATLLGEDADGRDGWSVRWRYPDANILAHLLVEAEGPGGTAEDLRFGLYHESGQ